ncbi:hypothetical protein AB0M12_13025 [Nocardia vinacea]|uniref:hypothetical protein n=1 Tax=Nocardia vinacea TaxID=96468 RepID=UPI003427037A
MKTATLCTIEMAVKTSPIAISGRTSSSDRARPGVPTGTEVPDGATLHRAHLVMFTA